MTRHEGENALPTTMAAHDDGGTKKTVMEHLVKNVTEPKTIEHLIKVTKAETKKKSCCSGGETTFFFLQSLRDKLQGINGYQADSAQASHDVGLDDHPRSLSALSSKSVESATPSSAGDNNHHYPGDGHILHTDTIVLMASCLVMIILGLVLRKIFLYFTHVRQSREKYHGGLRQMAEHMHAVTRTMSSGTNGGEDRERSVHFRKGDDDVIESATLDIFKPSTHVMVAKATDSSESGPFMTQLEARRLSKMQDFLANCD